MSGSINPKVTPGGSAVGQAALSSAGGSASALAGQGGSLFGSGTGKLNQASNYFSTLAGGNRSATAQALAPDVSNINSVYGGTAQTLSRFLRGPNKDVQMAEAERQRAGQIGNLFSTARTGANSALAGIGGQEAGLGVSAEGTGAGINMGIANTSQNAQIEQNKEQMSAGQGFGGLLFNIMKFAAPAIAAPFTGGASLAGYAGMAEAGGGG